ncbi:N-acetyltransferase [Amphritea opalescens]|uniref:N-acetyltransferase n=1 Tax=Amphritea opalescens TaxID=2490544 RepID=A0A430KQN9_9GAMM|nr:GNAT family N-acetyltransferase [Amphritea opalescens]RTE65795.1 N-acetyltransferase [Amphritea opalescens]
MNIVISRNDLPQQAEVIKLYRANDWSAADKPAELMAALHGSHTLVTARLDGQLIGLGNAISDGHLVVYYPHLLVMPEYQRQGVAKQLMGVLQQPYQGFHQQMLVADGAAIGFYEAQGFCRAGNTEPMWIYSGTDH